MFWSLLYMLNEPKVGRAILRAFRTMQATQWMERKEIKGLQRNKLVALLRHVEGNVPYYEGRNTFRGFNKLENLQELPIVTKETVRNARSDFMSKDIAAGKIRYSSTAGTTGAPLKVAKSLQTVSAAQGAYLRGLSWAGLHLGDRGIILKGIGRISMAGHMREKLLNIKALEAFEKGADGHSELIDQIRRMRPKYLSGYLTSLLRLAKVKSGEKPRIPVILSTGEMLYGNQREWLQTTFQARVFDYYGSNEINSVAYECEMGEKHVVEEHVILETVDENGNRVWDRPGRIVITDLDNYAMPLIRYEIGDMGVLTLKDCKCGRRLQVLKSLQGRTQDVLRGQDGKILPAIFFASRFRDLISLREYQIEQIDCEEIEIRYVPLDESANGEIDQICEEIKSRLGRSIQIKKVKMKEIPLTARGKRRLVIGMKV